VIFLSEDILAFFLLFHGLGKNLAISPTLATKIIVTMFTSISHYKILMLCIFYAEIGDAPLIFVLKMDEAEIIKEQKFECVSITLMNRSLSTTEASVANSKSFSVQAEGHIWPIATFRI